MATPILSVPQHSGIFGAGTIPNAALTNSSLTVTAGTGLSGGGSVALGASVTLSLPGVGPGASTIGGTGQHLTSITLDAQGRVTAAAAVSDPSVFYQTLQAAGVDQTQRGKLNFLGVFAVTDDGANSRSSVTVAAAGITNAMLANSSVTATAGTGLSGGGSVALGASVTLSVDQGFSPTWTGAHVFANTITQNIAVVSGQQAGSSIVASTAATSSGTQSNSPGLMFRSQAWENVIPAAQTVDWLVQAVPGASASPVTGQISFYQSKNGGAFAERFRVSDTGSVFSINALSAGTGGTLSVFGGSFAPNTPSTQVNFGANSNTSQVNIGRSGISTIVTGALSQLTGAVSLTANAASSFTTSSGALTLTAAAASTWNSADGTIKGATFDRTTAGTLTLAGTATAISLAASATIADAKTLTGSYNAIGTAQTVGWSLQNTTAAAFGAHQYSPMIELSGTGWNPTSASSKTDKWGFQTAPIAASIGDPSVDLIFYSSIAGGAYGEKFRLQDLITSAGFKLGGSNGATFISGTLGIYNSIQTTQTQSLTPDRDALQGYMLGTPTLRWYDLHSRRANLSTLGVGDVAPQPWAEPYITLSSLVTGSTSTPYGLLNVGGKSRFAAAANPGTITVTPTPTGGSTTWTYAVVGVDRNGYTTLVATGQTTTGPAGPLSATVYNTVSWTSIPGIVYYDIYLTSAALANWLGSTTSTSFKDTIGTAASAGRYTSPGAGSVYGVVSASITNPTGGSGTAQTYWVYAQDADGHLSPVASRSSCPTPTASNPVSFSWNHSGGAVNYYIARGATADQIIGSTGLQPLGSNTQTLTVTVPNGGLVRTAGTTVTATITNGHGLRVGDTFTLTSADANFPSGSYTVAGVASVTNFTYASAGSNATSSAVAISYTGPTVANTSFTDYAYPARSIGATTRNSTGDVVFDGQVQVNAQSAGNAIVNTGNASNFGALEVWRDANQNAHFGVDDAGFPSLGSRCEIRENWMMGQTISASGTNVVFTGGAWKYTTSVGATGFTNQAGFVAGSPISTGLTFNAGSASGSSTLVSSTAAFVQPNNLTNLYAVCEFPVFMAIAGANSHTIKIGMANGTISGANPGGWFFQKASGDTFWQCITNDGVSASTTVSSGVLASGSAPVANTVQMLRIEYYGSGSVTGAKTVKFYIDKALVATTTTNVYSASYVFFQAYSTETATVTAMNIGIGPLLFMYNLVAGALVT